MNTPIPPSLPPVKRRGVFSAIAGVLALAEVVLWFGALYGLKQIVPHDGPSASAFLVLLFACISPVLGVLAIVFGSIALFCDSKRGKLIAALSILAALLMFWPILQEFHLL